MKQKRKEVKSSYYSVRIFRPNNNKKKNGNGYLLVCTLRSQTDKGRTREKNI